MNNTNISPTDAVPSEGRLTSMSALERRRFLFKSIGKGAAAGAVLANPLLASAQASDPVLVCQSPTSTQMIICSVSGMQSAIGSRQLTTASAVGHSPGYWGKLIDGDCINIGTVLSPIWVPKMERVCPAFTWNTLVSQVLTSPTVPANVTLGILMANGNGNGTCKLPDDSDFSFGNYSNTTDCHWICAIFNAATYYPLKFPYSAATVRNVANGVDTTIDRAKLYTLLTSLEGTV